MNGPAAHSGPHWRRVIAALANRDARTAYTQIVLGEDILADAKEQRRTRAIAILLETGLVERTGSDAYQASETIFRDLLAWIVGEAIQPGEDLTERQVNERLLS